MNSCNPIKSIFKKVLYPTVAENNIITLWCNLKRTTPILSRATTMYEREKYQWRVLTRIQELLMWTN
jgi:hypothetical protein